MIFVYIYIYICELFSELFDWAMASHRGHWKALAGDVCPAVEGGRQVMLLFFAH